MKLKSIFTYGEPVVADKLSHLPLVGSVANANKILLGVLFFNLVSVVVFLNDAYGFIPPPLYKEDVSQEIKAQLPESLIADWYERLPSKTNRPWFDIFDLTGRVRR